MNVLMTGAIAMAFAVSALFFLQFWKKTRDRLFGFFALSFLVLAINRSVMGLMEHGQDYHYWIRLVAFVSIFVAIMDKNRSPGGSTP